MIKWDYKQKCHVDDAGHPVCNGEVNDREQSECRDLLRRVLDSIAIPANDEIYVCTPETVRDVLPDEIGQECERILGAAGKPCFVRWKEAGYDVEWEDTSMCSAPALRNQPPAYAIRLRGSMGLGVGLARLDSVAEVDAWIADQQTKEQKP